MSQPSAPQLEVQGVTLTFGGLNALTDVSLTVPPGEIVSIIGPNGAGKTSLLNCISGFYHPTRGRITFGTHDLSRSAPNVVTGYGIARAFQNLELFRGLSVVENLLLARHTEPEGPVRPSGIWKVFVETDDCAALYERAVEAGAEADTPPRRLEQFGVTIAFLRDPDGYLIELGQIHREG